MSHERRGVLVLGARNLGGAMARQFMAAGWRAAAVSRTDASLEGVRGDGALGLTADAADLGALRAAIEEARTGLGRIDAIVNAVSASRPPAGGGAFGGGPLADATLEGFEGWTAAVARQAFVFLSAGMAALPDGGALVQVTGGSARRAMPGRGLWAAGAFGVRALTQAAALELREHGIQVTLLIVDGVIDRSDSGDAARADPARLADAVAYLASQSPQAMTHELQVTPALDQWVP